jgi:hypothetical protein
MAMASTWKNFTKPSSFSFASSACRSGKITSLCSSLPCRSSSTVLQPVRKPGSIAITAFWPSGAANSSSRALSEKTLIAASSARFFDSSRISVSIAGASRRFAASCTASATWSAAGHFAFTNSPWIVANAVASSGSCTRIIRNISFSPRRIARMRCEGAFASGSLHSK